MPVFENCDLELALRVRGLTRADAVNLAMSEYNFSEAGAHAVVAMFIGKSGYVILDRPDEMAAAFCEERQTR